MRDALAHIGTIAERLSPHGAMFLLDFDGTLAPIVDIPADARPSESTLELVRACAARFPTAIVSGRALSDIEAKVGLPQLWYAGSHGLEWRVGDEVSVKETPERQRAAMRAAKDVLVALVAAHPGTIYEDKVHCAAINYRALSESGARAFSEAARVAVAPLGAGNTLRILDGMRTFEVTPSVDWTKGECALMLLKLARDRTRKDLVPVYIGDSITDEDAFRALHEGVTIRVGEDTGSAAHYFLRARDQVDEFLKAFTSDTD